MEDANYEPDNSYGADDKPAQLSQTDRQQQYQRAQQQVREWYRNELGREPSDAEVDSHLGGDYGNESYMRGIYSNIFLSPEGVEYRNRRGAEEAEKNKPTETPATTGPKVGDVRYPGGSGYAAGNQYGPYIETWNGTAWVKTANPMYGREPDRGGAGPAPTPGAPVPTTPRPSTSPIAGVPQSYAAMSSAAKSTIGGTVPTLADAVAQAKQYLPATPEISKPGAFTPPTSAWAEDRNRVVQAILKQPEVMGQSFQDALFEQQKEQQAQMAAQSRARLSQTTAARGLSAAGGQELLGQAGVEEGFINNLLSARRDVSTKAAEANRASSLAAVEMANAVEQGDFARAQAAYETQLKANQIYDQLRLQAAELERSNVALAAQNLLAQREMQVGEQSQSFDQYLRQLQMNEMIRQFNEQLALNYGKFGWEQQIGLANLFPGK